MKFFFHFAVFGFSNTYLVGPEQAGEAILIDPGVMDVELLKLIEKNNYYITTILVTHSHIAHIRGITTLLKVYNARLYGGLPRILDFESVKLKEGDEPTLAGFKIQVIEIPGHSSDSLVYRIGDMLFTGDALGAGRIGDTPNGYAHSILLSTIKEKLLPLEENLLIFPGHGPPSTLKVEKLFNPAFEK
ncbi:MAG: MBL fold metallo-hydrolase [Spirochaetota bacterium]